MRKRKRNEKNHGDRENDRKEFRIEKLKHLHQELQRKNNTGKEILKQILFLNGFYQLLSQLTRVRMLMPFIFF